MKYNSSEIELKWQKYWEENKSFKSSDFDNKPKYYVLDMFPYPSGNGLHVGHVEGYTATDIVSRYKRMRGFNVIHPIGWDAFGLPAENYAIKTGEHPGISTAQNINRFRTQLKRFGFSYDWDREVNTTDSKYYKWTQWIFLQLYKKGLAYREKKPINWCGSCKTGLANEEVVNGKCERCGTQVTRKNLEQWMLRITDYADKLLEGLDDLDWPENVKEMQKNWIGKSEGATVKFSVNEIELEVYTTRPDTLFGATYMVVSPEHPLLDKIVSEDCKNDVKEYCDKASEKSDLDRTDLNKNKTGVFTGAYAVNPVNKKLIPVWVADYVLIGYGTGAIMAVPAHDERDWEFAKKYNIPIIEVVKGGRNVEEEVFVGSGVAVNSGIVNGLTTKEAKKKMTEWLESNNVGKASVQYKLRDWVFSRQRYWGEPFPLIHLSDGTVRELDEKDLPVVLPDVKSYQPTGTGKSPLAAIDSWVNVKDEKTGEDALRETNTMPQWAGSCWYYLRYLDPLNNDNAWDVKKEKYWMPVDLYVGGVEHAVLHLLYARFWHRFLYDLGLVSTKEPFKRLVNQGMILGSDGEKMSKSRGNVINPDEIVQKYGADSVRLYEMFLGPLERVKPWNTSSIDGLYRFLQRVWRLFVSEENGNINSKIKDFKPGKETLRLQHQSILKVTKDLENLGFNTAISQLMILLNHLQGLKEVPKETAKTFLLMLAPFAPHICEEIWEKFGSTTTISFSDWPVADKSLAVEDTVTIALQVNGKIRSRITMDMNSTKEDVINAALSDTKIKEYTLNKTIVKTIVVPNKLVSIVVK